MYAPDPLLTFSDFNSPNCGNRAEFDFRNCGVKSLHVATPYLIKWNGMFTKGHVY
jgi:hypothetical protein